jgi:hypothetical protein
VGFTVGPSGYPKAQRNLGILGLEGKKEGTEVVKAVAKRFLPFVFLLGVWLGKRNSVE